MTEDQKVKEERVKEYREKAHIVYPLAVTFFAEKPGEHEFHTRPFKNWYFQGRFNFITQFADTPEAKTVYAIESYHCVN